MNRRLGHWIRCAVLGVFVGCSSVPKSPLPIEACSNPLELEAVQHFTALKDSTKKRALAFRMAMPRDAAEAKESGHTAILGFAWVTRDPKDFPIGSVVVTNPSTGKAEVLPEVVPPAPALDHDGVHVQATYVVLPLRLLHAGENVVVRSKSGKEYLYVTMERLRVGELDGDALQEVAPDPRWMSVQMSRVFCF